MRGRRGRSPWETHTEEELSHRFPLANVWGQRGKTNPLAELEEDFLKDENRPGAAEDGEGLPGEEGVRYPRHGGPEQGLDSTLGGAGHKHICTLISPNYLQCVNTSRYHNYVIVSVDFNRCQTSDRFSHVDPRFTNK